MLNDACGQNTTKANFSIFLVFVDLCQFGFGSRAEAADRKKEINCFDPSGECLFLLRSSGPFSNCLPQMCVPSQQKRNIQFPIGSATKPCVCACRRQLSPEPNGWNGYLSVLLSVQSLSLIHWCHIMTAVPIVGYAPHEPLYTFWWPSIGQPSCVINRRRRYDRTKAAQTNHKTNCGHNNGM